jgi:predicted RNA-binding Zn ribbon-like protein
VSVRSQVNFDHYSNHGVQLAVDLVNSGGCAESGEGLANPGDLASFLQAHGYSGGRTASAGDLEDVRAVRGRLRSVFEAPDVGSAATILNALLRQGGARPELTAHDGEAWHLHVAADGAGVADHLAAEAAMGLAAVIVGGGFDRLRSCAGTDCADVFVDASRNRSRRYCTAETCGNRANVAAHRARQRSAGAQGPRKG